MNHYSKRLSKNSSPRSSIIPEHAQILKESLTSLCKSTGELKYLCPKCVSCIQEGTFLYSSPTFSENDGVVKFIADNNIKILNLCHIPEEGRLKALSFSTTHKGRVHDILEFGERIDGSSLFSSIKPGKSDIYIVPDIKRAFANPFAILPTLNILCDYCDENGKPLDIAPKNVVGRAERKLKKGSNIVLKALAELEYYVIAKQPEEMLFSGAPDRNYHETSPFARFEDLRSEILTMLNVVGIPTKYGHSEVGRMITKDNMLLEQHEIEFTPQNLEEMAETVTLAKWGIRNICARHGVSVTFVPKISLEHAGNGMHIHLCALRRGKNVVADTNRTISNEALQMIGGILKLAPSLSAFGNPTPVSYLRFTARKESPMNICWSAQNRLALIRIPLWWDFKKTNETDVCRETFEYRAPDPFANAYLLFAGLALAANYGLEHPDEALKIAEELHVEAGDEKAKAVKPLPHSCAESAENLRGDRKFYEAGGVFPSSLIDKTLERLEAYDDKNLWNQLSQEPRQIEDIIRQYLHYG
jgi:glutamine synthetase